MIPIVLAISGILIQALKEKIVFLLIFIFIIFIIYRKAVKKYNNPEKEYLNEIKKRLTNQFVKVEYLADATVDFELFIIKDLKLPLWANIDENDIITLEVNDDNGKAVYRKRTKEYEWFLKNFDF